MEKPIRVIISGGGTGGHIFPALSIANAIRDIQPDAAILFVGAQGRMEMQRVPAAGYEIKGLPIAGFDRKHLLKNVSVLWKVLKSQHMARQIIRDFRPDVAVGVGGYASGPTLNMAADMGIPTLIQEQNSFAGVTNKLLAKRAKKICVAYEGMERFFPKEKIILTGNPVRQQLSNWGLTPSVHSSSSLAEAWAHAPSTRACCSNSDSFHHRAYSWFGKPAVTILSRSKLRSGRKVARPT